MNIDKNRNGFAFIKIQSEDVSKLYVPENLPSWMLSNLEWAASLHTGYQ